MRTPLKTALLCTAAVVIGSASIAGAKEKPKTQTGASTAMLAETCAGCHGSNGVSTGPAIPSIAGMSPTYLTEMMAAYKSGDAPSTIMQRIAKGYSTGEIEQIAEFYSKKENVAISGQTHDAAKAAKGAKLHDKYCEKCHSELGTLADDDSGYLMGQWKPYLQMTLADYHSGSRVAGKKMAKKMKKMYKKEGDAGVAALIEYYASQK